MSQKEIISVRVDKRRKEQYIRFLEEFNIPSLSYLINMTNSFDRNGNQYEWMCYYKEIVEKIDKNTNFKSELFRDEPIIWPGTFTFQREDDKGQMNLSMFVNQNSIIFKLPLNFPNIFDNSDKLFRVEKINKCHFINKYLQTKLFDNINFEFNGEFSFPLKLIKYKKPIKDKGEYKNQYGIIYNDVNFYYAEMKDKDLNLSITSLRQVDPLINIILDFQIPDILKAKKEPKFNDIVIVVIEMLNNIEKLDLEELEKIWYEKCYSEDIQGNIFNINERNLYYSLMDIHDINFDNNKSIFFQNLK